MQFQPLTLALIVAAALLLTGFAQLDASSSYALHAVPAEVLTAMGMGQVCVLTHGAAPVPPHSTCGDGFDGHVER